MLIERKIEKLNKILSANVLKEERFVTILIVGMFDFVARLSDGSYLVRDYYETACLKTHPKEGGTHDLVATEVFDIRTPPAMWKKGSYMEKDNAAVIAAIKSHIDA